MAVLSFRSFSLVLVSAALVLLVLDASLQMDTGSPDGGIVSWLFGGGGGGRSRHRINTDDDGGGGDNDVADPHARHAHAGAQHADEQENEHKLRAAAAAVGEGKAEDMLPHLNSAKEEQRSMHEQQARLRFEHHERELEKQRLLQEQRQQGQQQQQQQNKEPTGPISYYFEGPFTKDAELMLRTGLAVGSMVVIKGKLYGSLIIEVVSLVQDILVHVNIRSYQNRIVFNEQTNGVWGREISADIHFGKGDDVELVINVVANGYKLSVDGVALALYEYPNSPASAFTLSLREEDGFDAPKTVVDKVTIIDAPPQRQSGANGILDRNDESRRQLPLSKDRHVKMFIGVMSRPKNSIQRYSVRNAWMLSPEVISGDVAVRFFVGNDVEPEYNEDVAKEIALYDDIIVSPYVEGYFAIANKTRHILEVGATRIQADYVMKCDDDTYVRIDRILRELEKLPKDGLVLATISMYGVPIRDTKNKWYMPESEWAEKSYPPFPHGPGYVISNDLVQAIVRSLNNNEIKALRLEDVSTGTWIHHVKNNYNMAVTYKDDRRFNIGNCNEGDLIGHYIKPTRMVCMWEKAKNNERGWCCAKK